MTVERIHPSVAAVTIAVMRGNHTFRDIATATGMSLARAYDATHRAKAEGLVTWAKSKGGSIRPTLRIVKDLRQSE